MSLRPLAIVKDLKLLKVFLENSKTFSPLLFSAAQSLKSKAFLKNYSKSLMHGFRLAKLTPLGFEVVIPKNWWTENQNEHVDEAALMSAAHFGAEMFWAHINPEPRLWMMQLVRTQAEILDGFAKPLTQVRLKMQMDFQDKENLFFTLREGPEAEMMLHFDGLNADEQLICQIELKYKVASRPQRMIEG